MTDLIGFIGAFCTTISFLPQALKTIKTKNTAGISLKMYIIFFIGVFFWLLYGIVLDNLIMISANIITLALSGTVLLTKLANVIAKKEEW